MVLKYYSFEQASERIAHFIQPIKIDDTTILNLIRSKQLAPYIWFQGYVGTFVGRDGTPFYNQEVGLIEPIRGYLKLDYTFYLNSLEALLFGNNREILITEIADFYDLVHGGQVATIFNKTGVILSSRVKVREIQLPIKIRTLYDLDMQPGNSVSKRDVYFLAEEIESLDPNKAQTKAKNLELIEKLENKIVSLQSEMENLAFETKSVHPALDPKHLRFAPEIFIAIKINDYVEARRKEQIEKGEKIGSHESLVDEFFQVHGIEGAGYGKLKERLKPVSNSSSKKTAFINLAKTIE